jgi:hypothetical protein
MANNVEDAVTAKKPGAFTLNAKLNNDIGLSQSWQLALLPVQPP